MTKVGIDIGGTTIKGACFDEKNQILKEYTVATPARAGRSVMFGTISYAVEYLLREDTALLGVSSAGNIDPFRGVCVYATDNLLGWTGADIKGELERRFHLPVQVENDAICALKGELTFYPGAKDVTMLTFGTGLGGASLVNGEIVRGRKFDGARWGHVVLVPGGLKCNCGKRGCAENYLSATALLKFAQKKILGVSECKQIFDRFEAGEREAKDILTRFGEQLNVLLGNVRTVLGPEVIILGGGMAASKEIFLRLIEDTRDIRFAKYGPLSGVYGAIAE